MGIGAGTPKEKEKDKTKEDASIALKKAVAVHRQAETVMLESPVRDSKANGAVENAVKQVQGLARTLKISLERAISQSIPLEHSVIAWLVEYASFVLTARRFKDNGMTAYQHLRGRQFVKFS